MSDYLANLTQHLVTPPDIQPRLPALFEPWPPGLAGTAPAFEVNLPGVGATVETDQAEVASPLPPFSYPLASQIAPAAPPSQSPALPSIPASARSQPLSHPTTPLLLTPMPQPPAETPEQPITPTSNSIRSESPLILPTPPLSSRLSDLEPQVLGQIPPQPILRPISATPETPAESSTIQAKPLGIPTGVLGPAQLGPVVKPDLAKFLLPPASIRPAASLPTDDDHPTPTPDAPLALFPSRRFDGTAATTTVVGPIPLTPVTARLAQAPSAEQPQPSPPLPTIHVSIGRIEIRATTPSGPPPPKERSSPSVMSLDEYLRQRQRGGSQ